MAYATLEEARLRVERLIERAGSHLYLDETHRHLGLAGYECSGRLGRDARLTGLARAHERADSDDPDCGDELPATVRAIVTATEAVEVALVEGLADHLQSAHSHTLAACESFDRYLEFQLYEQPLR